MKISIVVPVYNCENYIGECIESVIGQTSDNWELILVNDGSTDKTADICNSYSEKYPQKIFAFHKENEGQFLTRKFGIMKCTGDYIGFLDADDLLNNNYIKTLSESIGEYGLPDALCFGFIRFDESSSSEHSVTDNTICFRTADERKTVYEMIVSGNLSGALWSKVFKKDVLKNNIPDDKIVKTKRYAEDAYHSFDALAKSESIVYLSRSLYNYRDNTQSFSHGYETRSPDYFNSKYLYDLIENNLGIMGIDNNETKEKLYERNFNETVYFMLRYLRAAKKSKRRKEIIDFDWSSYLSEGALLMLNGKNSFKESYLNIWSAFAEKKYITIFLREKFKKIIGW